ncbi:aminopeptidase P family N-terminal domain-containing protein [Lactobacillus delbrueckii]|uniref:aminopeptidase P family N-terminal domain-containing protein n=1 Tax=Lactobacillus delbrueckii TaxID=1584 RepID=UPI003BF85D8F
MKEERKLTWEEHLAALTSYLDEKGIDLAYVAEPVDIAYLTGYSSWTEERVFALLVSRTGQALLLAPAINERRSQADFLGGPGLLLPRRGESLGEGKKENDRLAKRILGPGSAGSDPQPLPGD